MLHVTIIVLISRKTADIDDGDSETKKAAKPRKPRQPKGVKAEDQSASDFGNVDWGPSVGAIDWGPMTTDGAGLALLDPLAAAAVQVPTGGAAEAQLDALAGFSGVTMGAGEYLAYPPTMLAVPPTVSTGQEDANTQIPLGSCLPASESLATTGTSVPSFQAPGSSAAAFVAAPVAPSPSGKFSLRPKHPLSIRASAPPTPSGASMASPTGIAVATTPAGLSDAAGVDAVDSTVIPPAADATPDLVLSGLPVPGIVHFATAAGPEYDDDYD